MAASKPAEISPFSPLGISPDHHPPERSSGEKVDLTGQLLMARRKNADRQDAQHAGNDDDQIEDRDLQIDFRHRGSMFVPAPLARSAETCPSES